MKTFLVISILVISLLLSACGTEKKPLTEAEKAAEKGVTIEDYKKMKEAAARMNMSVDQHADH
jgi:hypothetical protein